MTPMSLSWLMRRVTSCPANQHPGGRGFTHPLIYPSLHHDEVLLQCGKTSNHKSVVYAHSHTHTHTYSTHTTHAHTSTHIQYSHTHMLLYSSSLSLNVSSCLSFEHLQASRKSILAVKNQHKLFPSSPHFFACGRLCVCDVGGVCVSLGVCAL